MRVHPPNQREHKYALLAFISLVTIQYMHKTAKLSCCRYGRYLFLSSP